jgi:tetratricopeptide (TPR) repeat protein
MKYKSYLLFVLFFYSAPLISIAQQHKIDSLLAVLKSEKEDTNKVKTLNRLTFSLYARNPDTTILLAQQSITLSEKNNWKTWEAGGYCNAGIGYMIKDNYPMALTNYTKALNIDEMLGDKQGQTDELGNLGTIYYQQGDYPKALDYLLKALKIIEKIGDKKGQADAMSDIGNIYQLEGDYPKALDYYFRALKLYEAINRDRQLTLVILE